LTKRVRGGDKGGGRGRDQTRSNCGDPDSLPRRAARRPEIPHTDLKLIENLLATVNRRHPKHQEANFKRIGDTKYWIVVVDEEGELYCYRASLSLDNRWTLSPTYVT